METIGLCPLSQNSIIESMEGGDCFGICLDIGRSEAAINDPSKLVIKKVVPTYMTLDSFMDSSIYNLKKNSDVSGGFDFKNEGSLAIGLGNEQLSGIFPLYLFKEHW
jgi:hypothetical protein